MLDQLLNENELDKNSNLEKIVTTEEIQQLETQQIEMPVEVVEAQEEIIEEKNVSSIDPNKKAILYLINGLGIAAKDSFNINFQEVMPNMSMLMNNYLYTTLQNINYNYKNGFRNFSLGNDLLPTYHRLENDTNFSNNQTILNIANDAITNGTKVHLFCFLDNEQVIKQVMKIVNILTTKGNFMIYIHIVLRQKDTNEYEKIIEKIKKIDEAITLMPTVKIGTITGERKINSELYYTVISKENGEKWPDYNRKLRFVEAQQIKPLDIDPFYMNSGFRLERNDIALFLNYEDVDCDEFISKIPRVKLYTLFPMKSYSYAINIYDELEPTTYFSKILEENNLSCLILTTEDRISSINYNLCGLKEYKCNNITYQNITEVNDVKSLIKQDYNYIIFDYDIVKFKEIRKIKEFLMKLDDQIDDIYNVCDEEGYKFFISSLYGIYKSFIVGIDKEVIIDYSTEIPAVLVDRDISPAKFAFKYGTSHDLSNTIFNIITKNENIPSSIRKRSILSLFKD